MTPSNNCLDLIRKSEGLKLQMYDGDGSEAGNCTIGYGHYIHSGPIDGRESEHPFVNGITEDQAEDLLIADAAMFGAELSPLVKVPLTQNQFDALVDFVFNLGCTRFASSTLLLKLNQGDYAGAAAEFGRWVYVSGKVSPWQVNRRASERELFEL
jgi:lysozyme